MAVSHVFSNAMVDWTGTVTAFNSTGGTTTVAATNMVRPVDWNSGHNQFFTLSGNTNNSSVVSGTNIVFSGGSGVTLVGSTAAGAATIGISAVPPGTATMWYPFNEAVNVASAVQTNILYMVPVPTPPTAALGEIQIDRVAFPASLTASTTAVVSVTFSVWMGLYTKNNSTLSRAHSISSAIPIVFSGNSASFAGLRLLTVPWTTTIPDGRYYVGVISRTTTGGTQAGSLTVSGLYLSQLNAPYSGIMGNNLNATMQYPLGFGSYSATTTGLPASIAFSEIQGSASLAARPPTWFMISGTA